MDGKSRVNLVRVLGRQLHAAAMSGLVLPDHGFSWEEITNDARDMWLENAAAIVPVVEKLIDRVGQDHEAQIERDSERRAIEKTAEIQSKLDGIALLHHDKFFPRGPGSETCPECYEKWPCPTAKIILKKGSI